MALFSAARAAAVAQRYYGAVLAAGGVGSGGC